MSDKLKTVVKRSEWLRGADTINGGSFLLRPSDKKKCCLGFRELQHGAEPQQIEGESYPATMLQAESLNFGGGGHWMRRAASINDSRLSDAEREAALVAIFQENGEEIEFVD